MSYVIMGIITAFNLLVIKWKLEKARYEDGILDLFLMITVIMMFSGSMGGMFVGMVTSFIISIYLYFYPPKIPKNISIMFDDVIKDFNEKDIKCN